ncbi:MAG: hypothetical protein KC543_17900, partial [Myxococcales bacterium]|nr:hypothetical protein [Myxococcales bacterium]
HGVAGYRVYRDGALWRAVPAGAPGAYVTVRATGLEPETGYRFSVEAFDAAGQVTAAQLATTLRTKARAPIEVAAQDAPLGPGVPPFAEQWGFLTDGPDPAQLGVAPGALTPRRLTHLYGAVRTRGQSGGLSGVRVEVLGAPGVGYTLTDARGRYDLLVNGGGSIVLRFTKPGYLEVQRRVATEWQKSTFAAAVAMTALDAAATEVHLGDNASTGVQVARGSVEQDGTGPRQATLLFAEGTTATMTLADGSTAALPGDVHIRATELTVGADGPDAMPGIMPEQIAYTYAVELTVDEAEAAGAKRVDFNQPVAVYLENFIGAPVGVIVPSGWYDRDRAAWIPTDNGAVIAFTGVDAEGRAELDFDGDGTPEDATVLAAFGVTDAERTKVATLYTPGETLWRVPVKHFTPFDFNFGSDTSDGGGDGPGKDDDAPPSPDPDDPNVDDPTCASGSILYCENQTLGEDFELAGTGSYLHYQSDRVPGRVGAFQKRFPVQYLYPNDHSGDPHYAHLIGRDVTVDLAGRRYCNLWDKEGGVRDGDDEGCTDALDVSNTDAWLYGSMRWDGRDSTDRQVNAPVLARAKTCLKYTIPIERSPNVAGSGWGSGSSGTGTGGPSAVGPVPAFSVWSAPDDVRFSVDREGGYYTVCSDSDFMVGTWNASQQGLLGLTMSSRVGYDLPNRTLYRGDGSKTQLSVGILEPVFDSTVGVPFVPDGTPLADIGGAVSAMTVAPDGALYLGFGDTTWRGVIYRVDPDTHAVQRIAGAAVPPVDWVDGLAPDEFAAYDESGALATQVAIPTPTSLLVSPSGEVYFVQPEPGVVWKVDATGRLLRIAGQQYSDEAFAAGITVASAHSPDESDFEVGDATIVVPEGHEPQRGDPRDAHFGGISDIALARDGVLYIADMYHSRIRYITHSDANDPGAMHTLYQYPHIDHPVRIALSPEGRVIERSLYDRSHVLFKTLLPGDREEPLLKLPFAGSANPTWYEGDGRTTAQYSNSAEGWSSDYGIGYDMQGRLLFAWSRRLMREEPGERLFALAGNGTHCGNLLIASGAATSRCLTDLVGRIKAAPDGSFYLLVNDAPLGWSVQQGHPALLRWRPAAVAATAGDGSDEGASFVSDPARAARYEVNARGQELARYDLYSGALIERFEYDGAGQLARIVDDKGNTTLVARSADGQTVTLTAPFGEQTTLHDDDGDGYADRIVDPAGQTTALSYDEAASGDDPPGLLKSKTDRLGRGYRFQYDARGRVRTDARDVGSDEAGTQTLTLTPPEIIVDPVTVATATEQGTVDFQKLGRHALYKVDKKSAAGRMTTFRIERFKGPHEGQVIGSSLQAPPSTDAHGVTRREVVSPDGTAYVRDVTREGEVAYLPDGTLVTTRLGPDPLVGSGVTSRTITLPSKHNLSVTRASTATTGTLSSAGVPRLDTYTETLTGPTGDTVRAWDLATKTWTTTTPAGRVIKTTLGQDGRVATIAASGFAPVHFAYDDLHGRITT